MSKIKTIKVVGKTSDLCTVSIMDVDGKDLVEEKSDYVPKFLDTDGDGYGDYIQIEIDFKTGKILNWEKQKPLVEQYVETGGRIFD